MPGFIARFDTPESLVAAIGRVRDEGYTRLDAFTPFPLPEVTKQLGGGTWTIGWIAAVFALIGGGLTYATLYWVAAVDYPLNVGGRPLNSWAAFLPVVLVAAALWSGLATLVGMLYLCGLPRWHHPLFDIGQFDRASYDRFFLMIDGDDPVFSPDETRRLLASLGPEHIDEVGR